MNDTKPFTITTDKLAKSLISPWEGKRTIAMGTQAAEKLGENKKNETNMVAETMAPVEPILNTVQNEVLTEQKSVEQPMQNMQTQSFPEPVATQEEVQITPSFNIEMPEIKQEQQSFNLEQPKTYIPNLEVPEFEKVDEGNKLSSLPISEEVPNMPLNPFDSGVFVQNNNEVKLEEPTNINVQQPVAATPVQENVTINEPQYFTNPMPAETGLVSENTTQENQFINTQNYSTPELAVKPEAQAQTSENDAVDLELQLDDMLTKLDKLTQESAEITEKTINLKDDLAKVRKILENDAKVKNEALSMFNDQLTNQNVNLQEAPAIQHM